jgi:hypothetical protein
MAHYCCTGERLPSQETVIRLAYVLQLDDETTGRLLEVAAVRGWPEEAAVRAG